VIRNLSYIGFSSPAVDEWRTFGPDVLNLEVSSDGPADAVALRVDDAVWRVVVHRGAADDLAYLGWDVGDAAGLDQMVARVEGAGLDVTSDAALASERRVDAAAWFRDPLGFRHELTYGLAVGELFSPPQPSSGFVTGEQGVGHAVLIVPDLAAAETFLTDVLGFRPSDSIEAGMSLRFFHCPGHAARHHTLALVSVPGMVGVHHLMLEVESLDDVGAALDRVNEREIPLAMSLGRHPNDLMTSFYVRTPSGFEIEYGTGGVVIDDDNWRADTYDQTSLWGHKPPSSGPLFPAILRPFAETQPA
jgi:2,3-dihydroxybiphenyl 1,2-dioxygenase